MYTAKSCKGGERVPDALKWEPVSKGGKSLQKYVALPEFLWITAGLKTDREK
jgi:hypothetical protein